MTFFADDVLCWWCILHQLCNCFHFQSCLDLTLVTTLEPFLFFLPGRTLGRTHLTESHKKRDILLQGRDLFTPKYIIFSGPFTFSRPLCCCVRVRKVSTISNTTREKVLFSWIELKSLEWTFRGMRWALSHEWFSNWRLVASSASICCEVSRADLALVNTFWNRLGLDWVAQILCQG